jgi:hypothetical protein
MNAVSWDFGRAKCAEENRDVLVFKVYDTKRTACHNWGIKSSEQVLIFSVVTVLFLTSLTFFF